VKDLGYDKAEVEAPKDKRECYDFRGGEDAGMKRVKEYIWDTKAVGNYAATRNQLIGSNYSSKLSPWLATGNISPRYVYFETKAFEEKHRRNDSTKVYVDELFWRDYNRFWCLKYGNKVFSSYGIYDRTYYDWKTSPDFVKRWREGRTGMPLIDALMRDMNATGFMPNRGRMVVACYFTMDLKQHWLYGAYHFEEKLIDHDVQSNYGGWSFSSGIGPGRVLVFNSAKQSRDFDKNGEYIKMWVPELKRVPVEYIHEPWTMPQTLQLACKTEIGKDYPKPIPCEKYTKPGAAKSRSKSA
jgi:deoxyribodipyrimidine photo-lyase